MPGEQKKTLDTWSGVFCDANRSKTLFFARPISLFVQSGFCSAPDREFYAL
jgi:hypothetical protein